LIVPGGPRRIAPGLIVVALGAFHPWTARADVGWVFSHAPGGERYVALGDSEAAGPLIPNQRLDPPTCARSDRDFPTVAAQLLRVTAFRDVTCSGATIENLSESQAAGTNPPQFSALAPDTTLVTLGPIGSNNIGMVAALGECTNYLPPPVGRSCKDRFTAGGRDSLNEAVDRLAPKIGAALLEVHRRSPRARVFVAGYGLYVPPHGCYPAEPIWPQDADYVQGVVNHLDAVLAAQATLSRATYVSLQAADAIHHTTCARPGQRWLEGPVPDEPAYGFHPTALGMANFGRIVAEQVRASDSQAPSAARLRVTTTSPPLLAPGRTAPVTVIVSNAGTAPAYGVTLRVLTPRHVRARPRLLALRTISPGERRTLRILVSTTRGAPASSRIRLSASAGGGVRATSYVDVRTRESAAAPQNAYAAVGAPV
jgi:hypothetical protein